MQDMSGQVLYFIMYGLSFGAMFHVCIWVMSRGIVWIGSALEGKRL